MSFSKLKQAKGFKKEKKEVAEAKKLSTMYALLRLADHAEKKIKSLKE